MGIHTGRCLGKRVKEHRKAAESGDCANSVLAEHAWSHHHPVDWENVRVLEQQPRLYHRLTLESIHIRSHPHTLNRHDGTLPQFTSHYFPARLSHCTLHDSRQTSTLTLFIACRLTCCHSLVNFTAILAYIKRVTFCFVPATDEDNCMVVETFGN